MNIEEKNKVKELIREYCLPSAKFYKSSSYAMKSIFEKLGECYISEGDFIELMYQEGFQPFHITDSDSMRFKVEVVPSASIDPYYWGHGGKPWLYENLNNTLHG